MDNLEVENLSIILDPFQNGEMITFLPEFKLSINKYLQELTYSPVRSLAKIIEFNINNPNLVSIYTFQVNYLHLYFSSFLQTFKYPYYSVHKILISNIITCVAYQCHVLCP